MMVKMTTVIYDASAVECRHLSFNVLLEGCWLKDVTSHGKKCRSRRKVQQRSSVQHCCVVLTQEYNPVIPTIYRVASACLVHTAVLTRRYLKCTEWQSLPEKQN